MKLKKLIYIAILSAPLPSLVVLQKVTQAYDTINETKYRTYDGKVFESAVEATEHEEILKVVDVFIEPFAEKLKKLKEASDRSLRFTDYYYGQINEEKKAIEGYNNTLYLCIKKLHDKGYQVEIKLTKEDKK